MTFKFCIQLFVDQAFWFDQENMIYIILAKKFSVNWILDQLKRIIMNEENYKIKTFERNFLEN